MRSHLIASDWVQSLLLAIAYAIARNCKRSYAIRCDRMQYDARAQTLSLSDVFFLENKLEREVFFTTIEWINNDNSQN